jgi:hypothetical protein
MIRVCHDGDSQNGPQEIKNGRPRFSRDLPSLEFQIDRCNYHYMVAENSNPRGWRVIQDFLGLGDLI